MFAKTDRCVRSKIKQNMCLVRFLVIETAIKRKK